MGIYYYLANHDRKELVHYDNCVKYHHLMYNEALQMAFVNYLYHNQSYDIDLVDDSRGDFGEYYKDYKDVDLRHYDWFSDELTAAIEARRTKMLEEEDAKDQASKA